MLIFTPTTTEEAAMRLIENFTRDAKALMATLDTENLYSTNGPFTHPTAPSKLAGTTNNSRTPDVRPKRS